MLPKSNTNTNTIKSLDLWELERRIDLLVKLQKKRSKKILFIHLNRQEGSRKGETSNISKPPVAIVLSILQSTNLNIIE